MILLVTLVQIIFEKYFEKFWKWQIWNQRICIQSEILGNFIYISVNTPFPLIILPVFKTFKNEKYKQKKYKTNFSKSIHMQSGIWIPIFVNSEINFDGFELICQKSILIKNRSKGIDHKRINFVYNIQIYQIFFWLWFLLNKPDNIFQFQIL